MEYRTLGNTGTVVSTFCLGTMTFGTESEEKVAHEQLDAEATGQRFERGEHVVGEPRLHGVGVGGVDRALEHAKYGHQGLHDL